MLSKRGQPIADFKKRWEAGELFLGIACHVSHVPKGMELELEPNTTSGRLEALVSMLKIEPGELLSGNAVDASFQNCIAWQGSLKGS